MTSTKEDEFLKKRLLELARTAYHKGICTYSDFLGLNELNLFYSNIKEFTFLQYALWGGYEDAERRVVCFYEDDSFPNVSYPLCCLKIVPLNEKFSEHLTHRDYLGAILNLGIDRSKTGDILVQEKGAYLFCHRDISDFLQQELRNIRHTSVIASEVSEEEAVSSQNFKDILGTVSSIRIDALLACAFHTSRSSLDGLCRSGKVFVNGKQIMSNSFVPKEGDIISVRGMGRFRYLGSTNQTKKNKYKIHLSLYQ